MRTLLTLLRKDILTFSRYRTAVALTFIVPVVLIYIFGQVFGLNRQDSGPNGIPLGVINASDEPAARKLVDALKAEKTFRVITEVKGPDQLMHPLTEAEARRRIENHAFSFAVVIPADLIADDRIGLRLKILSNPANEIETQMVEGMLQKTLFASVPELLGESLQRRAKRFLGSNRYQQFNQTLAGTIAANFGGDPAEIEQHLQSGDYGLGHLRQTKATTSGAGGKDAPAAKDAFAQIVQLETEQIVGKDVKSPEATRVVGGWAIMFLLFAITGSSAAFFDEANTGIFQRLLSAPVTRAQLLLSRFLYGILLGLVQLTVLFLAGHLLYGIDVFGHFGNLLVICTVAAAACTSFGMLIAALAPNAAAANGLATFLVLVMSATGGAWWPISFMPEFMQRIGKLTVVYWSMEGFRDVLWAGHSLAQLLPVIGVLLGMTAVVMTVSIWRLNRKPIFG